MTIDNPNTPGTHCILLIYFHERHYMANLQRMDNKTTLIKGSPSSKNIVHITYRYIAGIA